MSDQNLHTNTNQYDLNDKYLDRSISFKKISWNAIFAGVTLTITTYLLLTILGTAIGASIFNPFKMHNHFNGIRIIATIWSMLSMLIAIAIGGYISGYFAKNDGFLHGILVWAINTLICSWLIITLFSSVINNAINIFGFGLQTAGNGISFISNQIKPLTQHKIQNNFNDLLKNELEQTILQRSKIMFPANQTKIRQGYKNDPTSLNKEMINWLQDVISHNETSLRSIDRKNLKDIIISYIDQNNEQAEKIVQQVEIIYQNIFEKYQQLKNKAEETTRKLVHKTTDITAKISFLTFVLLIIEGLLAGKMGALGHRNRNQKLFCINKIF
ncbi:MAG: YrzE family protein [Candidatus Dasytiphilus stammeri]